MMRAPAEEPRGLVLEPDVISSDQETELVARFQTLRFDPIVIRGQTARRTSRHFGIGYDYQSREPGPAEPIPSWLNPAREAAGRLAGVQPGELVEALINHYPPGAPIGWHRDIPAFGIVVGISLLSPARLRFQRGKREARRTWEVRLEPRSGYVLADEVRWSWSTRSPPPATCVTRSRSGR